MKVYIGEFTEQDLKQGLDKQAIAKAQEEEQNKRNGIQYIESKYIMKAKQIHSIKVWLTDKY